VNNIVDPYPLINNKTYFKIKYLIDEKTNINNPLSDKPTYYNLIDTFTNVETIKSSLNIPKQESQFTQLNNIQNITRVAEIAVPILYSQTASDGYTSSISLLKSNQSLSTVFNNNETISEPFDATLISFNAQSFNIPTVPITSSVYQVDSTNGYNAVRTGSGDPQLGMISASHLNENYHISWDISIPISIFNIVPTKSIIYLWSTISGKTAQIHASSPVSSSLHISYVATDNSGDTSGMVLLPDGSTLIGISFRGILSSFTISSFHPTSDPYYDYSTTLIEV
jgi:hypothetical protein